MQEKQNAESTLIRKARPGDEKQIHEAHMRSINEICIKDHGAEEVRGWGNRPLGDGWIESVKGGSVWVVEREHTVYGFGYLKVFTENEITLAYLHALYLIPEVLGQGFGFKLAKLMIEAAKDAGARSIRLESSLTAHDFYLKLGFIDLGPLAKQDIAGFAVSYYPMSLPLVKG